MHIGATRKEAFDEVREGYDRWLEYMGRASGRQVLDPGVPRSQALEALVEAGGALVGSVDDVVEGFKALHEQTGGFGTMPWALGV